MNGGQYEGEKDEEMVDRCRQPPVPKTLKFLAIHPPLACPSFFFAAFPPTRAFRASTSWVRSFGIRYEAP